MTDDGFDDDRDDHDDDGFEWGTHEDESGPEDSGQRNDDGVERGQWDGDDETRGNDRDDAFERAPSGPGTPDGEPAASGSGGPRTPEAGIDAAVAPWETGRGVGGPLRALAEVIGTVVGAFVLAIVLIIVGFAALLFSTTGEPGLVEVLFVSLLGSQFAFAIASVVHLRWRDEPLRNIGLAVPDIKETVLVVVGLVSVFVLVLVVANVVQAIGLQGASNATAETAQEVPSSLLLLIPVAIFVIGPCEELLFRGVVQRRLREVASAPVAVGGASAMFAVSHVVALVGDPGAMLVTVFILFVPSLVFGVLYEYTKNVVVTSLVHGLYDAVLFALLYASLQFAPEGSQPEGGAAILDALAALL